MSLGNTTRSNLDRRRFLRNVGSGIAASLVAGQVQRMEAQQATPEPIVNGSVLRPMTDHEKLSRIASNSYPIRYIFKYANEDMGEKQMVEQMRKKYGEITMLDFPEFTKKTFPGVYQMDLWSSLFGDINDDSQHIWMDVMGYDGKMRKVREFDPSSAAGKSWLERMANKQAATGTKCHHISNNAPRDICELDPAKRKAGVEVAKKWLDGAATLGAKSMRVNSGGPRVAPPAEPNSTSYATNPKLEEYLTNCIESFKEMADYGGKRGVKVTLENHWGLTANPINIRIIVEEVNNPFCEASPDFCNWENKYLLYHALQDLAPYAHTTCHAKFWDRFGHPDVQRNVRIMMNNNYTGVFALEYEAGPWDGVEGAQYLYREVMAAL